MLANYSAINHDLNCIDWDFELRNASSIDDMVDIFYEIIKLILDKHVPKRACRSIKYPTWYSKNLIKLIKEKDKLRRRVKLYANPVDVFDFEQARYRCHLLIKKCYNDYMSRVEKSISNNNIKAFWSYVKNKRKNTESIPSVMHLGNDKYDEPISICNAFAKHFVSVYNNIGPSLPNNSQDDTLSTDAVLSHIYLSVDCVEKALKRLDPKKGAGPDGIPAMLLSNCPSSLSYPLSVLYNYSLSTGTYPLRWKAANVLPIPKAGDSSDVRNYRPISLLSCLKKN